MSFIKSLWAITLVSSVAGNTAFSQMDVLNFTTRDGQAVQVQEDRKSRVTDVEVNKNGKVHTAKAYGSMYLTFLASMIATEIWYCNKGNFSNITDFEETPTCRDELFQMMTDPSMHAGIFAMTFTSLTFTDIADRATKSIFKKYIKSKADKPIALLQTLWQSVGMGLGISVQTIVNSTYNSPSLPQCMSEIKKAILEKGSTTEEAMKTKICQEAYDGFVSFENGTMSEITIAMYSLGLSTIASFGVMGAIQGLGMVFLNGSIQGFFVKGGLYTANILIEFFDRWMETTIRKYYHIDRSDDLLEANVTDFIKNLEEYEKTGSFFGTKMVLDPNQSARKKARSPRRVDVKNFNLLDDLNAYNKNIDYRRRAKLNTFMDSQSRWQQKLSGISEIYNLYKEFLKTVLEIRNLRIQQSDMLSGSEHSYNPMFFVGMRNEEIAGLDLKKYLKTDSSNFFLNANQKSQLKKAVQDMISGAKGFEGKGSAVAPYNIPVRSHGIDLMKLVLKQLDEGDLSSLRVNLWRLKGYVDAFHGPDKKLAGQDRQSVVDSLSSALEGVSSFSPATARGLELFEKHGMVGYEPAEEIEASNEEDKGSSVPRRRGMSISTESVDILKLHPRSSTLDGHSVHKLSNMLLHSVCNPNLDMIYDYNDGDIAKVTLPTMLKLSSGETFDCTHKTKYPSDRSVTGASEDHYYNSSNGKIVRIKTNPALHSIYIKDGREYLGLMDLLTSPEVEIRWNSTEELNEYWSREVVPGYLNLLGKGKMNYQNFLIEHFKLFNPDTGVVAMFMESDSAIVTPEVLDPFDKTAFRKRDLENYYENLKSGQAVLDQVRMVQHLYKTIGVENERSAFLKDYIVDLKAFLKALDITAYLQITPDDTFEMKDMATNPMLTMLGMDRYVELSKLNAKLSKGLAKLSEGLKDVPDFDKSQIDSVSEDQARLILEKVAFEGLSNMYKDAVFGEIFTDFLTGEGFIYSKELDAGIRSGTHIE